MTLKRSRAAVRIVLPLLCVVCPVATSEARATQSLPQPEAPKLRLRLYDGDDVLEGQLPRGVRSNLIVVRIDHIDTAQQQLVPTITGTTFGVRLKAVLRAGQTVEARYLTGAAWSDWSNAITVRARAGSDLLYSYDDDDNPFEVSAFIAESLDQFASAEALQSIGNVPAAGKVSVNTTLHMTAGFNMEYRLTGHAHSERQLWLFSRAIYAVRSGEVLCTQGVNDDPQFPCLLRQSSGDTATQFTKVLEQSKSFETISGIRADIASLQPASQTPVKVFITAQAGALVLAGADRALNQLFIGPGLRIPEGAFKETRVEGGLGYSQVFASRPFPRWKVQAFFAFPVAGAVRGFAEIRTDADVPHFHSISMFTVLGVHYEIGDLIKR
jgi:hypothetical protein